ncbi:hypothetical protein ASB57_05970 [Bordetella sp. N]|nr:hypothetical protein ASB57_05970 [Bordetella sp. N]
MTMPRHLPSFLRAAGALLSLCFLMLASAAHGAETRQFGGVATDKDQKKMFWTLPVPGGKQAAEDAAVAECRRKGGNGCKSLGWFADSCMAWAANSRRDLFPGNSAGPEIAAKAAIRKCTAQSPDGKCRLAMLPICVGPGYSPTHNAAAARARPADLEALSAKLDKREYWGTVSESETGGALYADDYPSEKEAVKSLNEWDECKNCSTLITYKDTCVGLAWPKGVAKERGHNYTILNPEPQTARDQARLACNAKEKTDTCVAMVRCSGRAYMDGYVGFEQKATGANESPIRAH